MAEYVTFAPKDSSGNLLDRCFVTIVTPAPGNEILMSGEEFGVLPESLQPNVVLLEEGDYVLWIRADGHVFTFNTPLTVAAGDGPDPANPLIVDLTATGSSVDPEQSASGWCQIYGHAGLDLPSCYPARSAMGFATTERLPRGNVQRYDRVIHIWRVDQARDGESSTLQEREYLNVSLDRNGYFEVQLLPDTLYRIGIPNIAGMRYFTSPAAGVSADVETLIDNTKSASPYELLGGIGGI